MERAVDDLDGREINGRAVKLTSKVCANYKKKLERPP